MKEVLDTEKEALDHSLFLIDKPFQNNIMSIRFGDKICESDHLLNRHEFALKWRAYYNEFKPQTIKDVSEDTVEGMILFDYYCYLSAVRYLYGLDWKVTDYTDK